MHPPKSEGKAPLFWSLLGVAAFACGVFAPVGSPFQRLAAAVRRLLELCEARTGLHEQFRHFNVPDF